MRILPISTIKGKLNEFVDAVSSTQDQITITKNGAPAAVLVGADEWESLQETLYWLAQPGIRESIAEADADIASGRTYGEDEIRAEFGVPRRPTERCLTPCGSPQPRVETSTSCHRESSRQWSNSRSAICRASLRVGKPLRRELAGTFSARRGTYRLLYRIDDEHTTVVILRVDHRADIYRR